MIALYIFVTIVVYLLICAVSVVSDLAAFLEEGIREKEKAEIDQLMGRGGSNE
jgi:replicative superfamily II helicase